MDKKKKSVVLLIIIVIVFILSAVMYNLLKDNVPTSNYIPIVSSEATIKETENIDNELKSDEDVEENSDTQSLMPNIPVKMLDGRDSYFWEIVPRGKPVVINLFASWCPPCKQEMPDFVEAREEYKDKVTFIFFDSFDGTRETETTLNKFVDEYFNDKDTLIVLDPGYLSYIFNTNSIPVTILLNEKGEVEKGFTGSISKKVLTNAIEELLN